nr:endo-alpha-N-acetylgalactosaminidase family protein [Paenibacillus aceris]
MIYYNVNGNWGWQTDASHYGDLTTSGPNIEANKDYTLKIKYIGKNIKVWLNDTLVCTGSADFPVAEGKVGLRSWFTSKNITVSQISQEAYTPPTPPQPTALQPITIASNQLSVSMDNRFPTVRSYTWLGNEAPNATLQGQNDFLYNVKINGNDGFATVRSATKTAEDSIVYQLDVPVVDDNTEEAAGSVNMSVTYKVTGSIVNMQTHINSEPAGYKVRTVEFPNHKLVTVSSSNPNAQGAASWVTGEWNKMNDEFYTNDATVGTKLKDQDAGSRLRTYGFVSDGQLAAAIMNDVVETPSKVIMNIEAESDGTNKQLSMWNGAWTSRGDLIDDSKFPPKFDFSSKIMITPDKNGDHTADWKDAAIDFRSLWSQNLHPGANEINNYVSYIAMNFNSIAQNPYLRTLDNAKKLYNLYDGFGQLILEKGYQAEGHDDSHPDVAGHFGIREGGLKDFNTLVDEGLKYNVKVGVHTNIDGQDPDAYYAKPENWGSMSSNYDWVDPTYPTDRAKDLAGGDLERRYTQLKQEVPNLAMIYDDVYSGAGWHANQFSNLIQNKLGFWFATEFSGPLEENVIWTHWGTDPYYPSKTPGSQIIRFIKNQYQDTFQAPSPYTSILLKGMLQAGVGTWQGRTDIQNGIDLFYNNNLVTKYMQHFPILNYTHDETGMDKTVVFSGGVVASLDEYHADPADPNFMIGTASLKKDGKTIAKYDVLNHKDWGDTGVGQLDVSKQQSQLFLPWDPQTESKIYYWNPKGGATTWELPNSWSGLTSIEMYKLTDTGRVWDRTLPVSNGAVTISNTTIGIPYVIYKSKSEEQNASTQKASDWGFGGPLKDPGFDSGAFESWQKTSSAGAAASNVTVEHDAMKNSFLKVTGKDDATVTQTVYGLKPGKTYTASVWSDINNASSTNGNEYKSPSTSDRKVTIGVKDYGGPEITNFISSSKIRNLEEPSKFKNTYYQRMKVDFVADPSGKATIFLKADAVASGPSNVWFDDVKLWENPGKTENGTHYFYEDFENVSEGYGPFMFQAAGSGGQTHLAEKASDALKAADPNISQPMHYVIDGNFSLKSNEQDFITNAGTPLVSEILATVPSTLKLLPNKHYKIGLKYEANKGGLYRLSAKSRSNGPAFNVSLSEATGTGKSNISGFTLPIIKSTGTANAVLEFDTGNYSDYYIAIESVKQTAQPQLSAIDVVLVVDDLYVDDLSAPQAEVTGVAVDHSTLSFEVGGAAQQLTANVAPVTAANKAVTWSSSNTAVATVDAGGLVTPVGAGTATITAKTVDGGFTASATVVVTAPVEQPVNATLNGTAAVIAGGSFELTYSLTNTHGNFLAQDMTFTYDPAKVEFAGAQPVLDGFKILETKETPGQVRIVAARVGADPAAPSDGDLLKLQWKAKSLSEAATATIAITKLVIANALGEETSVKAASHDVAIAYVDKAALNALIAEAQQTHDAAVEGTHAGEYPTGAKAALLAAISNANAVAGNAAATQQQVQQAAAELSAALQTFRSLIITGTPGDLNNDARVSIGDLALVAKYYGSSSADADWNSHKFADLNQDGVIDIADLAFIARLILN